jgi:hypothetical protein
LYAISPESPLYFPQRLREFPQALLITQKTEQHLVLVPVEIFEDLLDCQTELRILKQQIKNSSA